MIVNILTAYGLTALGIAAGLAVFLLACLLVSAGGLFGPSEQDTDFVEKKSYYHRHVQFKDATLLDNDFPDPRMTNHRPLRHAYYRKKVTELKRRKAVVPYNDGWVGILYKLWYGEDAIDPDSDSQN